MDFIFMFLIAANYIATKFFLVFASVVILYFFIRFIISKLYKPTPLTFETETNIPGIGLSKVTVEFKMQRFYGLHRQVKYYTTKNYQKFRKYNVGSDRWEKYNEKTRKWEAIQ